MAKVIIEYKRDNQTPKRGLKDMVFFNKSIYILRRS